ncbi:MAG: alpha/beta fold hydrolase [Planctomycetes bacterium]|nr:alpha/beta fold hydrolase [Planctomycetota bacterium]
MPHPRRLHFCVGLGLCVGILSTLAHSSGQGNPAQDKNSVAKVHFPTADGVEIQGTFYQATQRNAPAVILLHALGENSGKQSWIHLAEELQKSGYSVLTFDFRGHGNSKTVDPDVFWKYKPNLAMVKGGQKKLSEIDFQGMAPGYYPVMVNDIAAARAYLENKNDKGNCNVASTIVIGADTGATLGALWLNSEWYRYRVEPPVTVGLPATLSNRPEGKDVIAAIWLTATGKFGSRLVSFRDLIDVPARIGKTPMAFLYGDGDETGKTLAKACEKAIKGNKKGDDPYKYTGAVELPAGKLTGAALLQKSSKADQKIVEWLEKVAEAKGNEWSKRDFRKTQYMWRIGAIQIPAKLATEEILTFDGYDRFLPVK